MKKDNILTAKYYAQALADHATIAHWTDGNVNFHEQYMRDALAKIAKSMGYALVDITETLEAFEASDDISIAA